MWEKLFGQKYRPQGAVHPVPEDETHQQIWIEADRSWPEGSRQEYRSYKPELPVGQKK
jgi:hypothetical protein